MKTRLAFGLFVACAIIAATIPSTAQNTQCANRAAGDSTNACANTRFVTTAIAAAKTPPGGSTTQVQFNNAGVFDGSLALTWVSPALTIGLSGTTTGQLKIAGATSGVATITAQAVAATPTLTLPNASGTFAISGTSPIVLNATTGALTCPTCIATNVANVFTALQTFSLNVSALPGAIVGSTPLRIAGLDGASATVLLDTFGVSRAGFIGRRANTSAAAPSALLANDVMGGFLARGYGATGYINADLGAFLCYAQQNFTDANGGTYCTVETTPNNSTGRQESLRISSSSSTASSITVGAAGSILGTLVLSGNTSGAVTFTPQAVAGTTTLTLPNTSGNVLIGALGATDNLALRADGTGGVTAQGSALVIADTTASLTRSGNGGVPVQGTNTNDSAAAGFVGEFQSCSVSFASKIAMTTATALNLCSISLTAGDWQVSCFPVFDVAATTNVTAYVSDITQVSATPGASGTDSRNDWFYAAGLVQYSTPLIAGPSRQLLSATTTVFCVTRAAFTVSTMNVYGTMTARRMR